MDLGSLVSGTINDTLSVSLPLFRTEAALAAGMVLLLLCRMLPVLRWFDSAAVALGVAGALHALRLAAVARSHCGGVVARHQAAVTWRDGRGLVPGGHGGTGAHGRDPAGRTGSRGGFEEDPWMREKTV